MLDIIKQLKNHFPLFIAVLLLLAVMAWSDLSLPEYMSSIVDIGIQKMGYPDGVSIDSTEAELLANSTQYVFRAGGSMLLIALLGTAANISSTMLGAIISSKIARDLRSRVYQKVMDFSGVEMERFSIASLITRTTNDITQVQSFYQLFFRMMLYAPIISFGAISKVLTSNRSMSWIIALGVVLVLVLIGISFALVIPRFKIAQTLVDNVNRVLRENLTGLQVVRAFNNQEFEEKRFEVVNYELTENTRFINTSISLMMPAVMLVMNLITVLIVFVGAGYIRAGNLQVGEMMAYITYAMQIMMSFIMISMVAAMIPRSIVSMKRIREVLELPIAISDKESSAAAVSTGSLRFENVSFRYDDAEAYAIQNISFEAGPGQMTAIIGSTGSGKSTIVNLLMRFFEVSAGSIFVDGNDIRAYSLSDLRKAIALVPQKALLFRGTVEENVLFADGANADRNEERLHLALEVSQASEFVRSLERGERSEVAQGGGNFSGGQKQRLSIARALAKDAPILVFDDSFSALDYKTDEKLRKQIREYFSDRNLLVIAQRVTSIMEADQILVMDQGQIVGRGTHMELLKSCDIYREIAKSQLSEEELGYE